MAECLLFKCMTKQVIFIIGTFVFCANRCFKARTQDGCFGGIVYWHLLLLTAAAHYVDLFIGIRPVNWVNDGWRWHLFLLAPFYFFNENVNRLNTIFLQMQWVNLFTAAGIEVSLGQHLNEVCIGNGCYNRLFGGLLVIYCVIPHQPAV